MTNVWTEAVSALVGLAISAGGMAEDVSEGEVVVTATRTARATEQVAASVDVVTQERIEQSAAVTVDELLKTTGGADVQGSGFPGSGIKFNLRGLTPGFQSKRVLVLRDGRRLNEQYQGNAEFATFSAGGLERIEILRGTGSALYGSGAMGGVVQLFSHRGRDLVEAAGQDTVRRWRAAGGSYGMAYLQLEQGGVIGATDYFVNANALHTDGYLENRDGSARDWEAVDLAGNLGWTLAPGVDLRLFGGAYGAEGRDDNAYRRVRKDYQQLDLTWDWDDDRDAQLAGRVYRSGEQNTYHWVFPGSGFYDQETLAAEVQQALWVGEHNYVTVGGELRREAVDVDEVTGPIDESQSDSAFFVQHELHLNAVFSLMAGVRYDNAGGYGSEWSPRGGVVARFGRSGEIYASAGRAHRAPGLSDRFVNTVFNGAQFLGNPDLDPETLTAYEAGLRLRRAERWAFQAAAFRNELDDSFDFTRDPDGIFRIRNVTESRTQGVELSVRAVVGDGLTGFANYAYTDGTYERSLSDPRIEDNQLAYLAPHKAAAGLDWRIGRVVQSVSVRYVGERYGDAANSPAQTLDAYTVVDYRGRYRLTRNLDVTLNVDNIFDADYADFPTHPQPGVIVIAGLEGRF